jgi:hypothetical protein
MPKRLLHQRRQSQQKSGKNVQQNFRLWWCLVEGTTGSFHRVHSLWQAEQIILGRPRTEPGETADRVLTIVNNQQYTSFIISYILVLSRHVLPT